MTENLFPEIDSIGTYKALFTKEKVWRKGIGEILRRHGLEGKAIERLTWGSNLVYGVGKDLVLKVFCPLWPQDFSAEALFLERLEGRDIPIPRLEGKGELEGWPYLLMSRVEGVELGEVWEEIPKDNRREVMRNLGAMMHQIHDTPLQGLEVMDRNWEELMEENFTNWRQKQEEFGLEEPWLSQGEAFLEKHYSSLPSKESLVLLHGDITSENLLLKKDKGRWKISGLVDFGDALWGMKGYDFAAPAVFITDGQRELFRAMLEGYGLVADEINPALRRRLFLLCLLHEFANFHWILKHRASSYPDITIASMESVLYPL